MVGSHPQESAPSQPTLQSSNIASDALARLTARADFSQMLPTFRVASSLALFGLTLSCGKTAEPVQFASAISITADRTLSVNNVVLHLDELPQIPLTDTVVVTVAASTRYVDVDTVAWTLFRLGVEYLIMRSADSPISSGVVARLVEPEFEAALFSYAPLYISLEADGTICVLRGESAEPVFGAVSQLATIADLESAGADLLFGLGVAPEVPFDTFLGVLSRLHDVPASQVIVNAPVPGSSPSAGSWRLPESAVAIVFHGEWRDASRFQAGPIKTRCSAR